MAAETEGGAGGASRGGVETAGEEVAVAVAGMGGGGEGVAVRQHTSCDRYTESDGVVVVGGVVIAVTQGEMLAATGSVTTCLTGSCTLWTIGLWDGVQIKMLHINRIRKIRRP